MIVRAICRSQNSSLKKSYDLTTDDGICCVIATDDKNPQKNALDMLGTKVIQDVDPWHVSDEVIWDKRSQETVANQKREELQAIDFEEIPFFPSVGVVKARNDSAKI